MNNYVSVFENHLKFTGLKRLMKKNMDKGLPGKRNSKKTKVAILTIKSIKAKNY